MIPPAELRARWSPDGSAACWAEGMRVRPEQVTRRSMNFGQPWRTPGMVEVRCSVELPRAFVRDRLDEWLAGYADDARRHPSDDVFEAALRARGWPGGEAALGDPALHDGLFADYGPELLLEWLGDTEPDELPGWMLNSVDRWLVGGEVVVLGGVARRAGEAVVYQDGDGISKSLSERLERIPAKVAAAREAGLRPFGFETKELVLARPIEQDVVTAFEARHGVILPLEYRAFLMMVGNGGAGPGYGLLALEKAVWDYGEKPLPDDLLRVPFRHTAPYDPEKDDEIETLLERAERGDVPEAHADAIMGYETAGTLMLCDEGCGYHHRLVVTGPTRGSVWIDGRGGSGGFGPLGVGFLEWYERWLDDVLAGGHGTWWMT